MLKITGLHAYYGNIEALKGIDLEVPDGQIVCIVGANGAGKTTLLKAISGAVKCTGSILWKDQDIINLSMHKTAELGITHVPEGRMTFPGLTVYNNLEMGTVRWHGFFSRKPFDEDLRRVFDLFPRLEERKKQMAWSLSGGEQQMLAIGRGIMSRPDLLLLDEPSMGLAPQIVQDLFAKIKEINAQGVPILLVEQNAKLALKISDYAYAMEQGRIILKGPSEQLRDDPRIEQAYLSRFQAESSSCL